jgi:hypothetical protein
MGTENNELEMTQKALTGFEVIKNDNPDSNIAYYLKGRKAFGLVRIPDNPNYLCATDQDGKPCFVNGFRYFTDETGKLAVALPIKVPFKKKS